MTKLTITIPVNTDIESCQLLGIIQHWVTALEDELQTYDETFIDEEEVSVEEVVSNSSSS